ncbi:MAG: glycosyltransferase family 9 protein, partial [Woeseiaceae bacterium]
MRRILVIATPGIGDALLATPLVGSLKHAFPGATIDMIVRDGKAIVDCNADVSRVLVRRRRPRFRDDLKFMVRVARRYDLAVSTSTTDRAFIYMFVAASRRVGVVASLTPKSWWKRKIARCVWADPDVHTLSRTLELAGLLNIERHWGLVLPGNPPDAKTGSEIRRLESSKLPYAVIHMKPASVAREWPSAYWQSVIESLGQRGLAVAATGGG